MIRTVIFLLGLLVMAGALLFALVPVPPSPPRFGWQWWFALGLALAVGSHGFPEGLR
jgi:hypothetical protein